MKNPKEVNKDAELSKPNPIMVCPEVYPSAYLEPSSIKTPPTVSKIPYIRKPYITV